MTDVNDVVGNDAVDNPDVAAAENDDVENDDIENDLVEKENEKDVDAVDSTVATSLLSMTDVALGKEVNVHVKGGRLVND